MNTGPALSSLEDAITGEILEWGTRFELSVSPLSADDLVKNLFDHRIYDSALGQSQESSAYGEGFQRHLIYSLIRVAARYAPAPVPIDKKEFTPSLTWILFEEPEVCLHPNQITLLDRSLATLAGTDGNQVTISTHSPQFASRNIHELPRIVRLAKEGNVSRVFQVTPQDLGTVLKANQAHLAAWSQAGIPVDEDDTKAEMETIKYCLWLNPARSAVFFSSLALLVEGPTEVALIGQMIDEGRIQCPPEGVFLLDSMGKYNIHRFMNLLNGLGIRHAVLCDADAGPQHAVLNQTILASSGVFTLSVDTLAPDLETFLGIPKSPNPHRKPQHVLWKLAQGAIPDSKLNKLAERTKAALQI